VLKGCWLRFLAFALIFSVMITIGYLLGLLD
jgi:hypothetical protein